MKVALLTTHSRVAPVFETSLTWWLINATPQACKLIKKLDFNTQNEIEKANELLNTGVEMVICGAIPYYLEKILINQGCEVFAFTAGEVDEVVEALHLNQLDTPKFRMPGCQKRAKRGNNPCCKRIANKV